MVIGVEIISLGSAQENVREFGHFIAAVADPFKYQTVAINQEILTHWLFWP